MQKLDGSGNDTVSLSGVLAELEADLGAGIFGPGATGSATINPEDELSVTISNGADRTVASGIIAQNSAVHHTRAELGHSSTQKRKSQRAIGFHLPPEPDCTRAACLYPLQRRYGCTHCFPIRVSQGDTDEADL